MSEHVADLTTENFGEAVGGDTPLVVDFWAEWCGPCKTLSPTVEEVAGELSGRVRFAKVNVDDHPSLASQFKVMNIPTLLFFKGGEVSDKVVGVISKNELMDRVEALAN